MSVGIVDGAGAWSKLALAAAGDDASLIGAAAHPMPADMRVWLASSVTPLAQIAAIFATPAAQAGRKIVAVATDGPPAAPLFEIADMLVFSPAAVAQAIGADAEPGDVAALLPVQALLRRPNQAAVVRLPGTGAVALWADRTLFVAAPGGGEATAAFAATIAAAVDQGIGPAPALERALATAG